MVFAAIYRWKAKKGQERAFEKEWYNGTKEIYRKYGSLGSSLHKDENGIYVAYARWPSREKWENMWKTRVRHRTDKFGILVGKPILLDLKVDFLKKRPHDTKK